MGRQFVVRVEDRLGALSHLTHVLALRDINIEQIALVGSGAAALVALTFSDEIAARDALKEAGYSFTEGEPLLVQVDDRPGALAEMAELLAAAGVNVRSVLIVGRHEAKVDLALTVDDLEKARAAVARHRGP